MCYNNLVDYLVYILGTGNKIFASHQYGRRNILCPSSCMQRTHALVCSTPVMMSSVPRNLVSLSNSWMLFVSTARMRTFRMTPSSYLTNSRSKTVPSSVPVTSWSRSNRKEPPPPLSKDCGGFSVLVIFLQRSLNLYELIFYC